MLDLIAYCFDNPMAFVCEGYWEYAVLGFAGLGVFGVLIGLVSYIRYRRKVAEAIRAQWLRDQADEVGIREARWVGDDAPSVPDQDLVAIARAGIAQRRKEIGSPPNGGNG